MRRYVLFPVLILALALMLPVAAWSLAAGPKTAVYATESEQGTSPQVAARADGSFLVLWRQQTESSRPAPSTPPGLRPA